MSFHFSLPNVVILVSVIIYFIFDHFDKVEVNDEREELIRLKTFQVVQKVNTGTLLVLALSYFFFSYIPGLLIIFILILSSLYTEIGAKLYFRKKY